MKSAFLSTASKPRTVCVKLAALVMIDVQDTYSECLGNPCIQMDPVEISDFLSSARFLWFSVPKTQALMTTHTTLISFLCVAVVEHNSRNAVKAEG